MAEQGSEPGPPDAGAPTAFFTKSFLATWRTMGNFEKDKKGH